jgi:hypothetical protein
MSNVSSVDPEEVIRGGRNNPIKGASGPLIHRGAPPDKAAKYGHIAASDRNGLAG